MTFDRDSIRRVAAAHIMKQADDPRWFAQQIEGALAILKDAVDVADMPGGLSDSSGAVAQATNDIRRNISKRLDQHVKAVSRVRLAANKPLTKRQLMSLLKKNNIDAKVTGRGTSWEVELRDDATKRRFEKAMPSGYGWGGYRTGYGGWVLRPDYQPSGDWNDPSSRHHYAGEKQAASDAIFGYDRSSDIEFFFDPWKRTVEIGMGGEWWGGPVKMGKNVYVHRKERVDPAYRPVTVNVEKMGHGLRFSVMGGFGGGHTFVLGFKGM